MLLDLSADMQFFVDAVAGFCQLAPKVRPLAERPPFPPACAHICEVGGFMGPAYDPRDGLWSRHAGPALLCEDLG